MVSIIIEILKQVSDHRLPKMYDYQTVPSPWIQIKLLKILALLGKNDTNISTKLYGVLQHVLEQAIQAQNNSGYSVAYETIYTITKLSPNGMALKLALVNISSFINSTELNLKYLGIQLLIEMVSIDPSFASEYQLQIIECLENKDETLKFKTLQLLYQMATKKNVVVIVTKLMEALKSTQGDTLFRKTLIEYVIELINKFSFHEDWIIDVFTDIFRFGENNVEASTVTIISKLFTQEKNSKLIYYALENYMNLLQSPPFILPDLFKRIIAWVICFSNFLFFFILIN